MSKLLYANFFRMIRSRLFLIGMGFMFFAGSFLCFQQYRQLAEYGAHVKYAYDWSNKRCFLFFICWSRIQ